MELEGCQEGEKAAAAPFLMGDSCVVMWHESQAEREQFGLCSKVPGGSGFNWICILKNSLG